MKEYFVSRDMVGGGKINMWSVEPQFMNGWFRGPHWLGALSIEAIKALRPDLCGRRGIRKGQCRRLETT